MTAQKPFIPRAPRYHVAFEMRYRSMGEIIWQDGLSENVSRTGVLFRPQRGLALQTQIELMFTMPAEMASAAGMLVRRALVVRWVPAPFPARTPGYAAAAFEFDYTSPRDPRRI